MTYSVELTEQAESDLRSIFEYIAFELGSVPHATGQLNRLEKSIKGLKQMPERFKIYDREPWRSRNLRIMPVDNYLVFYIPNKSSKKVNIIRIMYSGRDEQSQLDRFTAKTD